ncbi:hypothetical protein CERSUDRAFT_93180 [Gelatoporia subvermispora B]|uniref:Uncharacterized protein n=1 Tax=Ceriporiopsis subvermispora (strain B) TaxID=914234 RepID=M2QPY9_CERS8|nr:hypothetical protein CERSUDRAFT_93180 [Gelatoporia subvermispora B]
MWLMQGRTRTCRDPARHAAKPPERTRRVVRVNPARRAPGRAGVARSVAIPRPVLYVCPWAWHATRRPRIEYRWRWGRPGRARLRGRDVQQARAREGREGARRDRGCSLPDAARCRRVLPASLAGAASCPEQVPAAAADASRRQQLGSGSTRTLRAIEDEGGRGQKHTKTSRPRPRIDLWELLRTASPSVQHETGRARACTIKLAESAGRAWFPEC